MRRDTTEYSFGTLLEFRFADITYINSEGLGVSLIHRRWDSNRAFSRVLLTWYLAFY